MVAVKYCRKEAFKVLIEDERVDLDTIDNQQRTLEKVIGIADSTSKDDDKRILFECLNKKRYINREADRLELSEKIQIYEKSLLELKASPRIPKEGNMVSYNSDSTKCQIFQRSFFRQSISESLLDEGYFTD
eukprot:GFUD01137005.1.p1 GENE.GFUD01137005.1~~GFUD01137005.1.p1  ORF type:complete len:132 (+),score=33.84 GFUD01137005.1:1-396(+)